ncbi:MAG: flavoprotein [Planctomycetota bacterium]
MAKKRVLLGVTGSIAAYKAANIVSSLVRSGVDVHVIMTGNATELVGPATFQALTGHPVQCETFHDSTDGSGMAHIDLPREADLFLVAPATANIIGKIAGGIADDLLSTTALSCPAPLLVAPAMNDRMWAHPAVQANVKRLESFGAEILTPDEGRLACATEGKGRLRDPEKIVARVLELLGSMG